MFRFFDIDIKNIKYIKPERQAQVNKTVSGAKKKIKKNKDYRVNDFENEN